MRRASFVFASGILGYLLVITSAAAQTLKGTGTAVLLENVGAGRSVLAPKWENGFFLTFDIPDGGTAPRVYVRDRSGKQVFSVPVVIPDSGQTGLTDASVSPRGEFAVTGGATDSSGRGTGFIAFIRAQGSIRQLVHTSPFTPRHICFASDGSLWAAGWELDENGMEKTGYDVLRQYGANGVLIKSTLSRSSLAAPKRQNPVSQSHLAASGNLVGMYSEGANEWIEVSSSTGVILGRWKGLNPGPDVRVRGIALTISGSVYLTSAASMTSGRTEYAVYKLSRTDGVWQPVNGASGLILGVDKEYVLVSQRAGITRTRAE